MKSAIFKKRDLENKFIKKKLCWANIQNIGYILCVVQYILIAYLIPKNLFLFLP